MEENLIAHFIKSLMEHGYPQKSLATDYRIGERCRADLVVIDPKTNIPIMIFEVKSRKSSEIISGGKNQLKHYLKKLPDSTIPAYLVFPKESHPFFEILRVQLNQDDKDEIKSIESLDYSSQRIARLSEKVKDTEKEKKKTIDDFKWFSWGLALILAVILVLKKVLKFSLDATDLTLLGGIIGLAIIPFASKIKFIGVEFERLEKAKSEE